MKIEIKHRYSSRILFTVEVSSLRLAIEAAVRKNADLQGQTINSGFIGAKL